ncbi:hypothetical protein VSDG_06271 [Cytospora chrysosperma]|uniref:Uncharacterized protein n=1 Tax=Cytospora chrysosperma TaxID=252740 RepID=A0A423VS96_CYTCH|nr:hypothetical protein VSDG_06271 [Valsa sordida]
MVQRVSIEAGCGQPSRRPGTPQQSSVDLRQMTFCFQAWQINNHPISESAISNRKMAEYVQSNLSGEAASRWSVTTSPPLRPKPSLAAPVSIRVKRKPRTGTKSPKSSTEDDRMMVLEFVHFRDQEYPILAKDYFNNHLRRRLDFHNVFAITASGQRVEELEKVVVSAKLNMRMAAALSTFGRRAWGDVSEGFTSQDRPATPEAPFKARLFLHRRYSDAWSVAPDEIISCPSTPNELESDEQGEEQADETLVTDKTETVASPEEDQREEPADEEWENISEKEVREACAENDDVVANKSTETEMDELLPKAVRDTLAHISPAFPFDIAWYVLRPYLSLQGRLAAVTRYARVIVSGRARTYDLVTRNLSKVALIKRRSKTARSYKLLGSGRTSQRAMPLGSFGVPASLALASAKWIMRQVKSVLRRVGRMMLRQDIR